MTTGLLGKSTCPAGTATTVYTCPAGTTATANIRVANPNSSAITVLIQIGAGAAADTFEPAVTVPASGVIVDTAEPIGAGEKVIITCTGGAGVCRVSGFEGPQ